MILSFDGKGVKNSYIWLFFQEKWIFSIEKHLSITHIFDL